LTAGDRISPGLATVLSRSQPLLAPMLGAAVLSERLTGRTFGAILVGSAGSSWWRLPALSRPPRAPGWLVRRWCSSQLWESPRAMYCSYYFALKMLPVWRRVTPSPSVPLPPGRERAPLYLEMLLHCVIPDGRSKLPGSSRPWCSAGRRPVFCPGW
jgi:hypothetical protein